MKYFIYIFLFLLYSVKSFAKDGDENFEEMQVINKPIESKIFVSNANSNNDYINSSAYIQNPYGDLLTAGGTQVIIESNLSNQTDWRKFAENGTYNIMLGGAYANMSHANNYAYGGNIFAQSGAVYGLSLGMLGTMINPIAANHINPQNKAMRYQFLPDNKEIEFNQAFLEYQYSNRFQADVGYVAINNSPWLSQNLYPNNIAPTMTYRGGILNFNAGNGWLLTALAFSHISAIGSPGFKAETLYNYDIDYGTASVNLDKQKTQGALALGGSYYALNNNYNLRVWAYEFAEYATLLYADNSMNFNLTRNLSWNLAAQVGAELSNANNLLLQNGYGAVNSKFVGAQAGINYQNMGLNIGYNGVLKASNSYGNGGIVSPYTYQLTTDPLYSTSFISGMVEKGFSGNALKVIPSISFLNDNLSIMPSYAIYYTNGIPNSKEYDFSMSYSVPQLKGLRFYTTSAYLEQPKYVIYDVNQGGNIFLNQIVVNYIY